MLPMSPFRTLRALRFLIGAPFILVVLAIVQAATYDGHLWIGWAALGIGIAWVACLTRVLRTALLVGGVAALVAYLTGRERSARSR
ncbi:MAG: hypothetical protein ACKVXR_03905 [Planctomycetota bacterium]